MATQRCPKCQAVNAAEAERCSLCGERMAQEPQAAPKGTTLPAVRSEVPAVLSDVPAEVEAEPSAPPVALPAEARYGGARERWYARAALGAGMGAATAGAVIVLLYAALSTLAVLPLVGRIALLEPLGAFAGGASLVLSAGAEAAVLGAVAGALTTLRDSPWTGAVAFGALAAVVRALALRGAMPPDAGWFGAVYGGALVIVDGGFGGACGYVVSLVVGGYLAATRRRPRD